MNFDPVGICRILNEERVEFVIVGGLAAVIHGSSLPTEDVDVLPSRSQENLERLAVALRRMNAKIRTDADPVAATIDAQFLMNMPFMLNLQTDFGILDLTFDPSGPLHGYSDWGASATTEEIAEGLQIRVASLDDVINSKRAAGREKDLRALPYLESLRDMRASDS